MKSKNDKAQMKCEKLDSILQNKSSYQYPNWNQNYYFNYYKNKPRNDEIRV